MIHLHYNIIYFEKNRKNLIIYHGQYKHNLLQELKMRMYLVLQSLGLGWRNYKIIKAPACDKREIITV